MLIFESITLLILAFNSYTASFFITPACLIHHRGHTDPKIWPLTWIETQTQLISLSETLKNSVYSHKDTKSWELPFHQGN